MIGFHVNDINVYNSILPYYENIIIVKNNFGELILIGILTVLEISKGLWISN